MIQFIFALLSFFLLTIFYWFKNTGRDLYGWNWSPFEWWLYTGLFSNYINLVVWWYLQDSIGVWKATIYTSAIACFSNVVLNSLFYSFNLKYVISLVLCSVAIFISSMK